MRRAVLRARTQTRALLLIGWLAACILPTLASAAGPDDAQQARGEDFLTVLVPVGEGTQAELHLYQNDRLDFKVSLQASLSPPLWPSSLRLQC
jgi:hypothetical protein